MEEEKQLPNNSVTRHAEFQSMDEASEKLYQSPDTSSEVHSEKEIDPVGDFKKERRRKKKRKKRIPVTLSKHTFMVHLSPTSLFLILFQDRSHPS